MDTDNSSSLASSEDGVVADRNVFVAEKIIRKRRSKTGVYEYFIKWQGWPHKYNTWEPEYNILDDSLVDSFAKRMKKVTKKKHKRTRVSSRTSRWQTKQRETHAEKIVDSVADTQYVKNVSICLVECPDTCAGNIFDNVLWSLNSCPRNSSRRYRSKGMREDSTEVEIDRVKVKIVEIPVEKCELQVATDHVNTESTAASDWTGFNSSLNCSCSLSPLVRNGPPFGDTNTGESSTRHSDGSLFEMLDLQYLRAPFCDARQIINSTTAMSLKVTSVMSVANTIYADA